MVPECPLNRKAQITTSPSEYLPTDTCLQTLPYTGSLKHSYVETKVSDNKIRYDLRTKENENFD